MERVCRVAQLGVGTESFVSGNTAVTPPLFRKRQAMTNSSASYRTCVVNNLLRSFLLAVFLALTALPGLGRAAPGDFVSLRVPDLPQAVGFFHDVMNCDVIAQSAAVNASPAAMLDCGDGITVELVRRTGMPAHESGVTFATDNAVAAAAWLRANHVVVGQLVRTAEGVDDEKVTVDFVTPWGQPMQLISHGRSDDGSDGTRLAAQ
jgi:catechol 2,3-dioxygenase-like lactoylglutathione lyase family enzyme